VTGASDPHRQPSTVNREPVAGDEPRVLVIGYGNPGRLDDGLGPALAAAIEAAALPGVTVDADYQLSVEDALEVAQHDIVVLADADVSGPEPFSLRRLEPTPGVGFSSHSVTPGALLFLARDRFHARCEAWVLGIRGYEFDGYGEGLSPRAAANLAVAVDALRGMIETRALRVTGGET
jgi:hydrogenase maturation protease